MIKHSKPWITESDVVAVAAQLQSGQIAEGLASAELEKALEHKFSVPRAVAVGSGSQALLLALRALGVDERSEVIVPTYVCPEVLGVVESLGATPVFSDVRPDYLLDPHDVQTLCTNATKAVVVPYLFGIDCDLDKIRDTGIPIIADWAQFLPGPNSTKCVADLVVLSFEATKVLAAGEGGAVLASDDLATQIVEMKMVKGSASKLNLFPFSDLQAALVSAQLTRLDSMLDRRRSIADQYFHQLKGVASIVLPEDIRERSTFFRFPLRLKAFASIEKVLSAFNANGIAVRRPVDTMLHQIRSVSRRFPVAEQLFACTISLPLYPAMSDSDVDRVIKISRELLN